MANLTESSTYETGVYQIEITDPVIGGANGLSNLQAKQLANRTNYLKAAIGEIIGATFEAAKAIKLKTARKINGVDFDGTSDITITAEPITHSHSDITPAGSVIFLARSTAPTGYLKANGAAVSRATYAALYSAIGTSFGSGDGSTTFNLPDLRGEFLRAWDDGRGIDAGRAFGSFQDQSTQAHTHYVSTYSVYNSGGGVMVTAVGGMSGISGNTHPRNNALLACIKY